MGAGQATEARVMSIRSESIVQDDERAMEEERIGNGGRGSGASAALDGNGAV